MRQITVLTHRDPEDIRAVLAELVAQAGAAGVTLRFDAEETAKLGLAPAEGLVLDAPIERGVELCVALGGDGTILRALQHYAGTGVPVFAFNFGEVGFLSTVEPDDLPGGVARALGGDFELLHLPAITVELPEREPLHAMNDLAITRKMGDRVAELSYALDGEEAGSVRCDGLVVATPAGSTGYNLANGGPVMAWGVEGLVVSFIAPHSLTARALVVAPGDRISIRTGARQPLDVSVDGRRVGVVGPDAIIHARFEQDLGTLAQLPGSSFSSRLRETFGRRAS